MLKEGSDPPRGMAALLMHQAMAMDVEAGVPNMTSILSATLNVAKTFRKDKDYGSVEPGKVADLSIIEGDPLQDIWATQNVKLVVKDGKVIDPAFTGYKNPIPSFYAYQTHTDGSRDRAEIIDCKASGAHPLKGRGGDVAVPSRHAEAGIRQHVQFQFDRAADQIHLQAPNWKPTIAPEHITEAGTYTITVKAEGEMLPEFAPGSSRHRLQPIAAESWTVRAASRSAVPADSRPH